MKNKVKKINLKKLIIIFITLTSFLLWCSFMHPTFYLDEQYTMSLIHHSYSNVVNINMLDVHPPTYYLILKLFLNVTTFWTSSIFIKIIFARLFSLIAFILMFLILYKLLRYCHIYINWFIQLIFYLSFMNISMSSVNIRMYSFYGLFSTLTFYQLLKFDRTKHIKNIVLATLFAIFTAYIDYFAAVCVGMFLLIFFLKDLFIKHYKSVIYLFLSGLALIISCLPLIILLHDQVAFRKKYTLGPNLTLISSLKQSIFAFTQNGNKILALITLISFMFITIWAFKYNKHFSFIKILLISLTNYILTMLFTCIICSHFNVFEIKFLYPQFAIYSFFLVSEFILMIQYYLNVRYVKLIISCMCLIIMMSTSLYAYKNYQNYIKPAKLIETNMNSHKYQQKRIINYNKIPKKYIPNTSSGKDLCITQYSTFMLYNNKKLIVQKSSPSRISSDIVNGKNNLLKLTFNNLHFD